MNIPEIQMYYLIGIAITFVSCIGLDIYRYYGQCGDKYEYYADKGELVEWVVYSIFFPIMIPLSILVILGNIIEKIMKTRDNHVILIKRKRK